MRKRTSVVWSIPKKELCEVVKKNGSFSKILKYFKLHNKGGNLKTLKKRLNEEDIDYSHIPLGMDSNKGRKFPNREIPLKEVMIENSTYNRKSLKRRLLKEGILKNECDICGQEPIHNNKKLVMVLDHINGVSDDHRLENLRILCPNCNSQQDTFAGRNNKKEKKKSFCKNCGEENCKNSKSGLCRKCYSLIKRKIKWPTKEELIELIKTISMVKIGKRYGVSNTTIRNWAKSYGINISEVSPFVHKKKQFTT